METVRLTTAQALVRWMLAQRTEIDGRPAPMFGGVFAIFGHGNVVALAEALQPVQDSLPTWRGHNEQSMALAAIAYAKAMNRRQIMVATSSIGPGIDQHGHGRRGRSRQPPPGPLDLGRHLPTSSGRSGSPASRGLRRSYRDRVVMPFAP